MPSLLAFAPFASPWMLAWGLAALVPIALHLWSKRQQHEVHWAAMEFLWSAIRRQSKVLWIERWLLLGIRVLILLVFAAALANPILTDGTVGLSGAATTRTHTVLVIDSTLSMAARVDRGSAFELACETALKLVRESVQGDGFTLVQMSDPPRAIVKEAVFDPQDLAAEIESLEVQHTVGGLSATLSVVEQTLDVVRDHYPRLTDHRVVFFTDLEEATWREVGTPATREQIASVAEGARLHLAAVEQVAPQNMAVTSLTSTLSAPTVNQDCSLRVHVENFGTEDAATNLQLFVDGRRIHQQDLAVRAGSAAELAIPHRFPVAGQHVVEVRLGDDDLLVDNRRWLSVNVRRTLRILCVEGHRAAARFVALALTPSEERGQFEPTVRGATALLESDLQDYDGVVLCNVAAIRRAEARLLGQYVEDGGGLAIFLGDRVQSEEYNVAFQELGWPVEFGSSAGGGLVYLDPLEYQHPVAAPFRGHERSGLLTTPTWRYIDITPRDISEVALRFTDGSPALVTTARGAGRIAIFATAASPQWVDAAQELPWTAMPISRAFPPLVHELLSYTLAGMNQPYNVAVGDLLGGTSPGGSSGENLKVEKPGGGTEQLSVDFDVSPPRWSFAETWFSGVYRLLPNRASGEPTPFAVNVDTSESTLRTIDRSGLPNQLMNRLSQDRLGEAKGGETGSSSLFRVLLIALLGLLVWDSALARWISAEGI